MTTDKERLERLGELENSVSLQLIMNHSLQDSDEIESVVFPVWSKDAITRIGEIEAVGYKLPVMEVTLQFVPNTVFYNFLEKVLK